MAGIRQILHPSNLRRTVNYIRKNGAADGIYAALERVQAKRKDAYEWKPLSPEELCEQQKAAEQLHAKLPVCFSILVPAYETEERYLSGMIDSVLAQTWQWFELVIADASSSACVERVVKACGDDRIRYMRLSENQGISGNSNAGLKEVRGDYTGLLDHDDLLTPDALYEMACALQKEKAKGKQPAILYSDEDKTDAEGRHFYDPHFKTDFNYDLFLSNNYICHFLVMETALIKQAGFRSLYDGAQDYDLILQALRIAGPESAVHVKKVLYHWRCHARSTAENPESKMYAYEAGRKAVNDHCKALGLKVHMKHEKHLGFYRVEYSSGVLRQRRDLGAVGGRLLCRRRVCGGGYTARGSVCYNGLPKHFSGYMHRAVLQQNVAALDIRFMRIRKETAALLQESFAEICGKELTEEQLAFLQTELSGEGQAAFLKSLQEAGYEEKTLRAVSLRFGEKLREQGWRLLYDPRKEWSL